MGETKCGSSEMQNRVLEIISLIIQVIEDNLSFSWLWVLKVYSNYIYIDDRWGVHVHVEEEFHCVSVISIGIF